MSGSNCCFLKVKVKVKVKSLSHVWLLATSWTVAHQAPPSMGFSRREYWSGVPLPSLSCIQISQEAGQVFWYSYFFKNFPQFVVTQIVKDFGLVSKAEVDVFLELSCFFCGPTDVDNLISGSSAFSKSSLNIWKFWVQGLLKPRWRILYITLLVCEMSAIVQ